MILLPSRPDKICMSKFSKYTPIVFKVPTLLKPEMSLYKQARDSRTRNQQNYDKSIKYSTHTRK